MRRKDQLEQGRARLQHGEIGRVVIAFQQKAEQGRILRGQTHQQPGAAGRGRQGRRGLARFAQGRGQMGLPQVEGTVRPGLVCHQYHPR